MPFVTIDGLQFHVQRLGRSRARNPDRPDRPGADGPAPLVMVHGLFSGSVASWFFTCAPTLAKARPVLLYDLRGHGRTDRPPSGYSSAAQASDLDALTTGLAPFAIVAHSFGALVAMRFALAHPERVTALALVEPPIVADGGTPWWAQSGSGPGGDPKAFDPARWLAAVDGNPSGSRGSASRQRLLDGITALVTETSVLAELRAEEEITDADLARLPSRLLAVFGSRSRCAGAAPRVRRVRPDAEIAIVDAGHAVHVDATGELTAVLERFVAGPAGRPVCDPSGPVRSPRDDGDAFDEWSVAYG